MRAITTALSKPARYDGLRLYQNAPLRRGLLATAVAFAYAKEWEAESKAALGLGTRVYSSSLPLSSVSTTAHRPLARRTASPPKRSLI